MQFRKSINRQVLFGLGGIILLAILGIMFAPRFFAMFYQIRGGVILDEGSIDLFGLYCAKDSLVEFVDRDRLDQSKKNFHLSLRFNPSSAHSNLILGHLYCLLGEPETAVEYYLAFNRLRPENPLGHLGLGFAYESLSESVCSDTSSQESRSIIEFREAGFTALHSVDTGDQFRKQANTREALRWYTLGTCLDPAWSVPWLKIARLQNEENRWDEAINAYTQAAQRNPEDRGIWYELGQVYEGVKEWQLALASYQNGINASAGNAGLSNLYFRIGRIQQLELSPPDHESAWQAYERALELDDFPVDNWQKANTLYYEGTILASQENWQAANQKFQQAYDLNPKHYWVNVGLARSFWKLGDITQAKRMANNAIEIDPDQKNTFRLLGDIYRDEGNISEAVKMYRIVLQLDPSDNSVIDILNELEKR